MIGLLTPVLSLLEGVIANQLYEELRMHLKKAVQKSKIDKAVKDYIDNFSEHYSNTIYSTRIFYNFITENNVVSKYYKFLTGIIETSSMVYIKGTVQEFKECYITNIGYELSEEDSSVIESFLNGLYKCFFVTIHGFRDIPDQAQNKLLSEIHGQMREMQGQIGELHATKVITPVISNAEAPKYEFNNEYLERKVVDSNVYEDEIYTDIKGKI